MTGDDQAPRTLYVGNLSPLVTEELLLTLFGQIGDCKNCKIIHEPGSDAYAFVEFADSHAAAAALAAMNKRSCYGKEMKVNWATTSGGHQGKIDLNFSEHYHIFVGDLAPEIDQQLLREAFAPHGDISDVKIMKDPHTLVHKGYGFISFINKTDAESAIASMNGQWLGTRKIRTNWATRKVQPGGAEYIPGVTPSGSSNKYAQKLDYNEVWARTSDVNTTVYCGGVTGLTDELVRNTFGLYGQITGVHAFPDRGYSFVRFATKEAACHAICAVHGMDVNGSTAKCSWGKENIEIPTSSSSVSSSMYGGSANNGNSAAAALAAAQQNAGSLQGAAGQLGGNVWNTGTASQNSAGWANAANAANYQQWAGYPQNAGLNYWQPYQNYQNAMMQQGWGVMPTATGTAANPQYQQMGQYQQGTNGKS